MHNCSANSKVEFSVEVCKHILINKQKIPFKKICNLCYKSGKNYDNDLFQT